MGADRVVAQARRLPCPWPWDPGSEAPQKVKADAGCSMTAASGYGEIHGLWSLLSSRVGSIINGQDEAVHPRRFWFLDNGSARITMAW